MRKILSWEEFCKEFLENDYIYDLVYKNNVYTLGSQPKRKKNVWFLATQHAITIEPFDIIFDSPQELLENATLEGAHLKDIWDEIELY